MIIQNPKNELPEDRIPKNRTIQNLWIKNWEFWESLKIIQKETSVQEKQHDTTTSGIAA